MKKIILKIDGMTCSGCSNGLEKYLNKQEGILNASVNLVMANALIEYDEKKLNLSKIETFVKDAGFKSLGLYDNTPEKKKNKKEKIKFIVFGILAIILLYVSMGPMVGLPIFDFLSIHTNPIFYSMFLFLLTIAFLCYGFDILKNGYKNLIHKAPNMDTLVSIGVISSFLYSIYNMILIFNGNTEAVHHLYFESASIILFFIKLGRYLDNISKDKTKEAIQKLVQITPNKAIIKVDGIEKEKQFRQEGNSIIYIVQNKKIVCLIGVNDVVRKEAKKVLKTLKDNSIETIMLTGDNTETANVIAKEIGIENVIAEVMPSEKANIIKKLKTEGKKVMMCGDGINDSPALANSDVGVSINSGTDIAMDSSDVILMKDDLTKILDLISISKHTIKNIKQNLFWAFFYNILMIPIAIGLLKPLGISINPMIASFAMVISSLTVILNSLRLRHIKILL